MRAIEKHASELGPDKLLVLQYHLGDTYSNSKTEDKAVEYGVVYPPTLLFNGGHLLIGSTEGSYVKQSTVIEQELAKVPSLAMVAASELSTSAAIDVTMTNTGTLAILNSTLFFVLYEDLGTDEYHYTVREIIDPQAIPSLEAGVTKQVSVTSSYAGNMTNIYVVVYLKGSNGEILQAALASG